MKPIANPARSADLPRNAAIFVGAGDSVGFATSSHHAGTELDVRRSRCCHEISHALASNFMDFLGNGQGGAVSAIATVAPVAPLRRFGLGAGRREAARRGAWLQ